MLFKQSNTELGKIQSSNQEKAKSQKSLDSIRIILLIFSKYFSSQSFSLHKL